MFKRATKTIVPTHCLECDTLIPEDAEVCPKCRWTWKSANTDEEPSRLLPWFIRPSRILAVSLLIVLLMVTFRIGKAYGYHQGRFQSNDFVISSFSDHRKRTTGQAIDGENLLYNIFWDSTLDTFQRFPPYREGAGIQARRIEAYLRAVDAEEAKRIEEARRRFPIVERMMSYPVD